MMNERTFSWNLPDDAVQKLISLDRDQRKEFFEDPSKIMYKTVTIQYFEESKNKDGEYSLRFPVLKHVYENERCLNCTVN